jgi:murein DD-endopeptidase MepM/ murein hydrolase activator NlpD
MEPTRLFTKTPYTLQIRMRDGTLKSLPILKSLVSVGRDPENDIVIDDPSISRQHAFLRVDIAGVWIEDRRSSNGTFIGSQRLSPEEPVRIPPGKAIRFGTVEANIPGLPVTPGWTNRLRQGGIPLILLLAAMGLIAFMGVILLAVGVFVIRSHNQQAAVAASTQTSVQATQVQATQFQSTKLALDTGERFKKLLEAPKCDQPGMLMLKPGQIYIPGSPGVPGRVITSTAFLDLPFPYDGGNENFSGSYQQFVLANQRNNGKGGRINSYFDHFIPVYPCSKDPSVPSGQEPCEPPIGGHLLRFDGTLTQDSYSGHPGYDYSTFEYRLPTTPVFAAADGKILYAGEHSASGALFVEISHTVPGVGDFMTLYWHLNPDQFYEAMLGQEGKPIKAGTRIGTMGNTGFSTGHHLHFEVRFDADKDGKFPMSEVIDPYGYIPSPLYPTDPWYERTFIRSTYLWIYPLSITAIVPESGGGVIPQPGSAVQPSTASGSPGESSDVICVLPGDMPAGTTVYWSYDPAPAPTDPDLVSPGGGAVLSVVDPNGVPVTQFTDPLRITIPYLPEWITEFQENSLGIYIQVYGSEIWQLLPTRFDATKQLAYALTDQTGRFAIFGKPIVDMIPPKTTIELSGPKAADGSFYDVVTVTLKSSDPSGVAEQLYSLDDGTTWKKYTGPFQVSPNGIPSPLPVVMDADFHGGIPGTLLVLASATDGAKNVEDPPKYLEFSINPTKNPAKAQANEKLPEVEATSPPVSEVISKTVAVGPDNFPADTNALTGEPCKQPETISFAPAGVSVTNFPASARPQAGLSFAPWVHELFIGEGMTRFLALFYCDFPSTSDNIPADNAVIGPIRSGRLPYESIRKLFSGFLVMASADPSVGANLGESVRVYGTDDSDINSALIKVDNLKAIAAQGSQGKPAPNLTGNRFDPTPPTGGMDGKNLWIFWSYLNQVLWNYDPAQGVYLRSQDNADGSGVFTPSTDRLNGQRLGFDNVIVLYADHTVLNRQGTLIDINLLFTRNTAYLFRDGNVYPIYWNTTSGDYEKTTGRMRPFRFTDKNGNPFPLKPGNTWVEIVDLATTTEEIQPGDWKVRFYAPETPK